MAHRARQRRGAPLREDRDGERDVRQVRAAVIGIVQQKGVAVLHALGWKRAHDPLRRELQRAQVDGDGRRLRDGLSLDAEERRRGVEPFLHNRRGRTLEQRELHLVGDGVQAVAQHLEQDGVDGDAAHAVTPLLRRRLPERSTSAVCPGGITVVVSACSTMAGPDTRAPTASRARS